MTAFMEQDSGQDFSDATQIRLETSTTWSASYHPTPPQFRSSCGRGRCVKHHAASYAHQVQVAERVPQITCRGRNALHWSFRYFGQELCLSFKRIPDWYELNSDPVKDQASTVVIYLILPKTKERGAASISMYGQSRQS